MLPIPLLDGIAAKFQDVLVELSAEIEQLCGCGFTSEHITLGEFQCLSQPDEVTYRARLSGTTGGSSADIVADIEEWIASGEASLKIQGVRRPMDSTCLPVAVEDFKSQECGLDTGSTDTQSDNTAAIVGGVVAAVAAVLTIAITVLVITILFVRRRRAKLTITSPWSV